MLALCGAVAAGCGSSSGSGGSDDPAALIPAGAPVYVEGVLHPDGKVRSDLEGALKKILRTDDPGAKITQLLNDSGKGEKVTFKDDVEPWLGDRFGVAVTALHNGRDADYVAVIASKDDGKADKTLAKQTGDIVKRSYKGVDYRFDRKDKTATAIVDHRVVVGTEAGLKAVVDAKGGDTLDESNGLGAVRSKVAQDRVGLLYLDVQGLLRTVAQTASSDPQVGAMLQSFSSAAPKTIGAALQAQPDALRIDAVSIGTPKSATTGGSGADILATLPGDSWLGLGVANLGQTLDRVLQTVAGGGGLTGVGVNALLGQFQKQTGLDLRKDVLGWMGDAGVFVGGSSSADLGGALVIKTTDPAKTKRTMTVLAALRAQAERRHEDLLAAGQGHRRRLHRSQRDRARRPGRPRRRSLRGRDRRPGRPAAGDLTQRAARLGAGLHRRRGQARQRPAALVLSRLHPGGEAARVLRGLEPRLPEGQALPRHLRRRSPPVPRTRARASPGRASSSRCARSPAFRRPAARPPGAPGSSASRRRGRSPASRGWA